VRDLKVAGQKSFDIFPNHKILFFEKSSFLKIFNNFFSNNNTISVEAAKVLQ